MEPIVVMTRSAGLTVFADLRYTRLSVIELGVVQIGWHTPVRYYGSGRRHDVESWVCRTILNPVWLFW